MIDPNAHRTATPKLGPDDLEGTAAMVTISSFEEVDVPDEEAEGGTRRAGVLTFEETGEKVLWTNGGMVETLCDELGRDETKWIGAIIPVEVYTPRYRGKNHGPKVRVVPSEEWPKAFKEAGLKYTGPRKVPAPVAKPAAKAAAKPTARKGGKR